MSAARAAPSSETPTDAEFLARARSLVPILAAREAETAAARAADIGSP